jgi:transposase
MKKGRGATMTHDYKRNGTTTLFAALDTATGEVYGLCQQRHRHQEWLRFLRMIDQTVPAGKEIYLICDNYATHKHERVQRWLEKHKRFHVRFTPTSASWLNMIERFFRDLTTNQIRRASSRTWSNSSPPSATTSTTTTTTQSPSSGPQRQTTSSKRSPELRPRSIKDDLHETLH